MENYQSSLYEVLPTRHNSTRIKWIEQINTDFIPRTHFLHSVPGIKSVFICSIRLIRVESMCNLKLYIGFIKINFFQKNPERKPFFD